METRKDLKLISALLALLIALPASSCSSKKKKYEVIKETDPWFEVTSFETANLYPSNKYEYSWFEVVGATEDSVYLMAEASKHYDGDYNKLTDEELLQLYEQSILRYSFDGELLEKTNAISYQDGKFRTVQKAWISDGRMNLLERIIERNKDNTESDRGYLLNGEELTIPEFSWHVAGRTSISDIYTTNGFKVFSLYDDHWEEEFLVVVKPDGSQYEPDFSSIFQYGVSGFGEMLPAENGKVIFEVFVQNELSYVKMDLATGEVSELKGLYGSEDTYMLEHCNGKTISRDLKGLNVVDAESGTLKQLFDYSNVDESFYDVIDTQTLYVSDDGNDIVLGGYVYDNSTFYSGDVYKIMHLKRADRNPNAGKTVLTLSLGKDAYPEYSDLYAAKIYNRQDNPCFIKFVMPYDESGEYQDVNADILLLYNPVSDPSDSSRYLDLAPYFNFSDASYKQEYFSNALDAAKSGSSLYRIPLDISASGIITDVSNVPAGKQGFTFDEYKKFLNDKCNGTDPISKTKGFEMNKQEYFTKLFLNMSDIFIKDGKVNLEGEDFRNLMLFVDEYGGDKSAGSDGLGFGYVTEHNRSVYEAEMEIDTVLSGKSAEVEGKIGAVYGNFYSFENYLDRYKLFGSNIGVYGLPSYDGRGPLTVSSEFVSVSLDTKFPDACVDFVKLLISYDVQCQKESNPINRKALRYIAEKKLDYYNSSIDEENKSDRSVKKAKLGPEAIDKYEEILSSSYGGISAGSSIESILREESSAYFNGQKSLDDVITVMQKRLQTVIDESK